MDFEDFYGRYADRVVSYVMRHTALRDAEDIVAETFTVAWRKRIERLDDPMPWLIVTARNITRQVRRREVRAGEITDRPDRPDRNFVALGGDHRYAAP